MGDPRGRPFFVPSDASSLSSSVAFRLNTSSHTKVFQTVSHTLTCLKPVLIVADRLSVMFHNVTIMFHNVPFFLGKK